MVKKRMDKSVKPQKRYYVNFDKFFELVTRKTPNEKNNDSTITEIWQPGTDGTLQMMNKEMVDNKFDINNNICSMRYDFLNGLINQVLSVYTTPTDSIFKNEGQMSFGQRIIFDSFIKEGVIYEIK